jgi:hypothetical protein
MYRFRLFRRLIGGKWFFVKHYCYNRGRGKPDVICFWTQVEHMGSSLQLSYLGFEIINTEQY